MIICLLAFGAFVIIYKTMIEGTVGPIGRIQENISQETEQLDLFGDMTGEAVAELDNTPADTGP